MINLLLAGLLLFGIGCSKDEPEKEDDKDYGGSRCAEDSWGIAFADHIRSTIKKFDVSNSELHLIDSLDNTVILFIDGLNKN